MRFSNPEDIIAITPEWKGERFPDGRPKVADKYLDALYNMTLEELKPYYDAAFEASVVRSVLTSKVMKLIRDSAEISQK